MLYGIFAGIKGILSALSVTSCYFSDEYVAGERIVIASVRSTPQALQQEEQEIALDLEAEPMCFRGAVSVAMAPCDANVQLRYATGYWSK